MSKRPTENSENIVIPEAPRPSQPIYEPLDFGKPEFPSKPEFPKPPDKPIDLPDPKPEQPIAEEPRIDFRREPSDDPLAYTQAVLAAYGLESHIPVYHLYWKIKALIPKP